MEDRMRILDAIFIVTNAPGRSAFNRVERRMAPLSTQLWGLILKHDAFGSHLDKNGKTIDKELEIKNFAHAGKILADIWSELVIDKHPVVAEFKYPNVNYQLLSECNETWYMTHVRESQYLLQICKCSNCDCCKPFRSNLFHTLQFGFLPPPVPFIQDGFFKSSGQRRKRRKCKICKPTTTISFKILRTSSI